MSMTGGLGRGPETGSASPHVGGIQGEPVTAVLTFFDAVSTQALERPAAAAADREQHDDGRAQAIAFAAHPTSPTPAADEAEEEFPAAGFHIVSAPSLSPTQPDCMRLPAQLTIPEFGEAEAQECNDDLPLEVKLAFKPSGRRRELELAFIVLPPELPEHGLSISAVQWCPASRKHSPTLLRTGRGADARLQQSGMFWKCMLCVGNVCRDTCCFSQTTFCLSCGVVLFTVFFCFVVADGR